ncbi:MAG TPA: hypothetical protein VMW18_18485 [Candidatus Binatia bacterium]|nr:hypothetical protein [Candidatus Binatia bacterium]
MRLPLKFLPRRSNQIAEVVGSLIVIGFSLVMLNNYLPQSAATNEVGSFGAWLHGDARGLPFLGLSILLFLAALGWLTVALINLFSGSPFRYFIVDRQGISHRTFWHDRRYSWRDLDPIQSYVRPFWRSRGNEQRYWIVEGLPPYRAGAGLRIRATDYLGSGWLSGTMALSTDEAANWLESLRQLARQDRLEPDDIPPPPEAFRAPIELERGVDSVRAAVRKPASTVDR